MVRIVHAQLEAHQAKKIQQIQVDTGLTVSQILRRLVDSVQYEPVQMQTRIYENADGDSTPKGETVAV